MWEHSGKALMWRYGTPIAAAVSSEDGTCLSEAGYWSGLTKRTCLLRGHSPLTVSLERSKIHFTWTPGYLTSVLGRTITPLEATRGVRQMSVSGLLRLTCAIARRERGFCTEGDRCAEDVCMSRSTGNKMATAFTTLATWRVTF